MHEYDDFGPPHGRLSRAPDLVEIAVLVVLLLVILGGGTLLLASYH